ncbi:MAG: CBS domain-containing protein [Halieaceae bacterium]|nr:CBS domain-containing protein [Halieaceae bacterium]MDG1493100.1 transporter associated domain-containing protein [Luminiphilus sp.]MBT6333149.1 CBS domain-containing protein [Halieaceae bacterium]MBT7341816.1 CBS domain-containing protein [Halieaceae bacterium]MDG1827696.1 transporter associated domain-containing protein [Luminiphilus sp.]
MNDTHTPENDERSWVERLTQFLSGTPQNRADLEGLLELAVNNELIDDDAKTIMEGALSVSDMQVRDIMIPRAQMTVIKIDAELDEALPQIIHAAHSRFPVIDDNLDNVIGILLAKDLLPLILEREPEFDLRSLLRPAVVVPESKRLNVLLREFRQNRNHMAIVIDEYGGVAGLVTIEDVLEEIVGEIEDETDVDEGLDIRKISPTDFFVKAQTPIEDFNEHFGVSFSNEEFDTIGGLVVNAFGHVPTRSETTYLQRFEFKVVNADQRRLLSLRVTPPNDPAD